MDPKVKALLDAAMQMNRVTDHPVSIRTNSEPLQNARKELTKAINGLQAEATRDELQYFLGWLKDQDELSLSASNFIVPLREVINNWGPKS